MPAAEPTNPATLLEVSSTVYPKLERVPGKQNWVDKAGGLPSYIERIAKHLHYEKGKDIGTAIAIAVNTVKKWATGVNHNGSKLKPDTVAKAQAAVAQWEAKKAKSHVTEALIQEGVEADAADRASLAGAFAHRLMLAEGMAVGLKGSGTRNRGGRVANAKALLEGSSVKLSSDRSAADPRELARVKSMLGNEIAELRFCVEALGIPPVIPPQQAGPPAPGKRPPAKGRGGQALPWDESKHPRAAKGRTGGGQFIRAGSTGPEVKGIQRQLGVKDDGRFGPQTKAAVEDFQKQKGIKVDGVVGSQTAGALRGADAVPGPLLSHQRSALRKAQQRFSPSHVAKENEAERARGKAKKAREEAKKASSSSSSSSSSSPSSGSKNGGAGSVFGEGSSLPTKIAELIQRKLGISTSGSYDEKTKERVEEFQKNNGLEVDGIVGTQTLAALRGDKTPPAPGAFTQSDWTWLSSHQAGGQREKRHEQQAAKTASRQTEHEAKDEEARRRREQNRIDRERKHEEKLRESMLAASAAGRGFSKAVAGDTYKFDPSLHPRDQVGKFTDKLNDLSRLMRSKISIPAGSMGDATTVYRRLNGFHVFHPAIGNEKFGDAKSAAERALEIHGVQRRLIREKMGLSEAELREDEDAFLTLLEAVSQDDFHRKYGAGMTGQPDDATGHLQNRLIELGYDPGANDGRYGEKTKAAVQALQGDHGLKTDGEVGSSTKAVLRGTDAETVAKRRDDAAGVAPADEEEEDGEAEKPAEKAAETKAKAAPADEPDEGDDSEAEEEGEAPSLAGAVLTKGDGVADEKPNEQVKHMQGIVGAEKDGRFGPETEKKLKSTQRRYGLKADGVVGPKTGRLLDRMAQKAKPSGSKEERDLNEAVLRRMEAHACGDTNAYVLALAAERTLRQNSILQTNAKIREASFRGLAGDAVREFYRLDDGTFAPKGRGRILKPGETISLPHRSGAGTVGAKVEHTSGGRGLARITSGPDEGRLAGVRTAAPQGSSGRPFPQALRRHPTLPPGNPEKAASVQEVKGQEALDQVNHHIAAGNDQGVQDVLDDMEGDHSWSEKQGYGAAVKNFETARDRGEHFLRTGHEPPAAPATAAPKLAPIDFHGASDSQLEDLIAGSTDANGLAKSGRDRSIFKTAVAERKRRALTAYRSARSEAARSAAADRVAQLTGQRPEDAPLAPQFAPPEGYTANAGEKQMKEMGPGDTFYVGKHDQAYVWHKPTSGDFIVAKPVDGGKAKVFHKEFAPPFIGPQSSTSAPAPPVATSDDALHAALKQSLGEKATSPARSPSGNLRNFKAMGDKKLTALAEEMTSHPQDTEAIAAITAELQSRADTKGEAIAKIDAKLEKAKAPKAPAPSVPKTAEPAKAKSKEDKIAAAWGAYHKKKAEFDALPADADKPTKSKAAAQVRAAKFRIKRVGGDFENPPDIGPVTVKAPAPSAEKGTPIPPAPKPPKAKAKPKVEPPAAPEPSFHELVAQGLEKEHAKKAEDVAEKTAKAIGSEWDAASVKAALDKLETSGIVFDREKEAPAVLAAVIKAAGLAPAELQTAGTV